MSENNIIKNLLPSPGVIQCSNCGTEINNSLHRAALAYACPGCDNYFIAEKGFGYKARHSFVQSVLPDIPIKSRAEISGKQYEVTGFIKRRQVGTQYEWREYMLFNPACGFITLSEFNGHWNLIRPINDYPRDIRNYPEVIQYKYNNFQLYNKYKSTVKHAAREFPYDLFLDKSKTNVEWIAPPFMLIREKDNDELCWFLAENFTDHDLKKAFGETLTLPERSGVGATQLIKLGIRFNLIIASTLIFIIAIALMAFVFNLNSSNTKVFSASYSSSDMNKEKVIVTPPFQLTGGKSALQFDVYASVSNDWFEIDIELINDITGERFEVAKSIEFYTGYDDEGAWSEGSRSDYIIMSSVPDGNYHLNLYPQWNPNLQAEGKPFEIKVFRDVTLWANFWILFLVSLIVPSIQFMRLKTFEAKRWMESDYSPTLSSLL